MLTYLLKLVNQNIYVRQRKLILFTWEKSVKAAFSFYAIFTLRSVKRNIASSLFLKCLLSVSILVYQTSNYKFTFSWREALTKLLIKPSQPWGDGSLSKSTCTVYSINDQAGYGMVMLRQSYCEIRRLFYSSASCGTYLQARVDFCTLCTKLHNKPIKLLKQIRVNCYDVHSYTMT